MTVHPGIPPRDECVVGPLLDRWAREQPQRNFLEFSDGTAWTFAEMLTRAQRAAAGLRRLGVARGSHVLSWMPNEREAILGWFGANLLGAVYVPLNTAYRGAILRHAVALSDAKVMIAHASLLPRLESASLSLLEHIVCAGGPPPAIDGPRMHAFDVLEQPGSAEAEQPVQPWDANYIILTSGTTGPSKAVVCTYIQAWVGGAMAMDYFGKDDRLLANLPLFHVSGAGAVMDRLTKGGTCVLYDGFKPESFWDTVRRFNITGCCLVGAMTRFLLNQPPSSRDRDHPLRAVITVPWNQDSLAVAQRFGIEMHTAFNMTELATPIRSQANPPVLGTCGQARPGRRVSRGRRERYRSGAGNGRRAHRAHVAPMGDHAGLLQESRSDRARLAQRLVPYRRRISSRRAGQLLLRRPHEGRDPPARREHLVLRGGVGSERAS